MKLLQTTFKRDTRAEFISGTQRLFGLHQRCNVAREGDIVLLQDLTEKSVFAIAKLGKFENGSVIREHSLLESELYNKSKYNKFELAIGEIKILPKAISFIDLSNLIGIDNTVVNNITKGTPMNFSNLFYKENNSEDIFKRLKIWISTIIQ